MNIEPIRECLRCPLSKQKLKKADENTLKALEAKRSASELFRKNGQLFEEKIETGLVTSDQQTFYPIVEGIPQLLAPEGIPLNGDASQSFIDIKLIQYREPYAEMNSYDDISSHHINAGDAESALGGVMRDDIRMDAEGGVYTGTFPEPAEVWLDAKGCLLAQESAYKYLTPLSDTRILQIGGHGSHLIKFLLAGAREAWLVSPMIVELRRAMLLSRRFGFEERFFAVQGIAEELPTQDDFFDRIYSGGCLHHTVMEMTGPEVHRVLKPDGKASFVDPIMTVPYRMFVKPFYSRGIGRVDNAECSPILKEKASAFIKHFNNGSLNGYRTFVHFPLIMATRYLKFDLSIPTIKRIEQIDRAGGNLFPFVRDKFSPIACLCVQK